jgi:cytochrome P450
MDMGLEALLAMGAGSDTTSTALANIIYYLISYPVVFARLRAELDAVAGEEGASYDAPLDSDHLAELKYLQAVINETLRLQPAVPNGVQRTAHGDHGPLPVAGYIIPAGTSVQIPTWSSTSSR